MSYVPGKFEQHIYKVKLINLSSSNQLFSVDKLNSFKEKATILWWMVTMTSLGRETGGFKPFNCKTCNKNFTSKTNLIKHEQEHTNVKPFSCTTCAKNFFQEENLKAHQEKFHEGRTAFKIPKIKVDPAGMLTEVLSFWIGLFYKKPLWVTNA